MATSGLAGAGPAGGGPLSGRAALHAARAQLDSLLTGGVSPDAGFVERTLARLRGETEPQLGDDDLVAVADQLFAVADLLDREIGLRRALADPGAAPDARVRLFDRVLGTRVTASSADLLRTLVRGRWSRSFDLVVAVDELGAQALLAAEEAHGTLDDVEDQLFRFARLVERTPRLSLALSDPGLPEERKHGLVERLLAGRTRPTTVRLVRRMVARPRGRSVARGLDHLARLASERRQRSIAVVTVARPLSDEQADELRAALTRTFRRDVQLQVDVDPNLLGGVVVRVGDEVIDGSVVRRLVEARRRLLR